MARERQEWAAVNARRERVWKRWVRGESATSIAERESVSVSTISRDIQARQRQIRQHQANAAARDDAERQRAISGYRAAIAEAWEEWERSKGPKERRRTKTRGAGAGGEGATVEAEEATEGRLGDPQYLNAVVRAQTKIDELLGLVPSRHEHQQAGPEVVAVNVVKATVADLLQADQEFAAWEREHAGKVAVPA